jgi:hypothetical protein
VAMAAIIVATTTAGAAAITADTGSRPRTGRVRLRYLTPLLAK